MGFPIIMYLSNSKIERFWDRKNGVTVSQINPSISFNPSLKIDFQTEFEKSGGNKRNMWPPRDSLDIVIKMEQRLLNDHQIGNADDFLNGKPFLCYKMKGKIYIDRENLHVNLGKIIGHGVEGIFVPNGTDEKVLIGISYENIAGLSYEDGNWHAWESGAFHFFEDSRRRGYDAIGLFTYEGEAEGCFARCGIVYFASANSRFYRDKGLSELILNDYLL